MSPLKWWLAIGVALIVGCVIGAATSGWSGTAIAVIGIVIAAYIAIPPTMLALADRGRGRTHAGRKPASAPSGASAEGSSIRPNEVLRPGDSIKSANGRFVLEFERDGDLALLDGETRLWSSGTADQEAVICIMQSDGNLVLYRRNGRVVWKTDTEGRYDSVLTLQDDGNVVIYDAEGKPIWASGTVQH